MHIPIYVQKLEKSIHMDTDRRLAVEGEKEKDHSLP